MTDSTRPGLAPLRYRSMALPSIPADHPDFVWKTGADVQATWIRLTSWRPIYTNQPPKYEDPIPVVTFLPTVRRFK